MLNTDVKKQINTARDILVGKIPDPKGQIDQITNALIYKFMDDQDRLAQTLPGGKPSFFIEKLEQYAWHKLFDSKLSNQDRANLYIEGIEKLSKAKNLPDLFRDIFKDAFLPFRDADTIAMFLNEINKFDYHHSEDLGNAFEYLLSIMGSQGDAGQFRTPRNIIEFVVDAVNPTKNETILDPACGTAGFLVEAYKHITEETKLSPNEVQDLAKHINGVDIDPGMAKIARVNLYLHGFKTPLITENDTLTNESLWGKKYDVVLANPPFMTPKGGIKPHDKFSVQSKRAEVLFTDYIAEHLKLAGRAGIVVPEGIIFQSSNIYKQLRKKLVDDNYLWGVISLPAGVFNPYSGVKTSILLLDRARAKENTEIMFYKVEDDGFGLGAQRRESKKNDLPEALKAIENWRNGKKLELEKASYVEKGKIAEDGDYNLGVDRYQIVTDHSNAKWPMVELQELVSITTGKKDVNSGNPNGEFPFFTCAKECTYSDEYSFDDEALLIAGNGVVGDVKYYKGKFEAYQRTYVLTEFEDVLPRYLYSLLKIELPEYLDKLKQGNTMPYIKVGMLQKYKLPLPPIEIQEQIVAELKGYSSIISGAKQIVDNWKPNIDIDPEWEKVKLNDVCDVRDGTHDSPKKVSDGYPLITSKNIKDGILDFSNISYISEEDFEKVSKRSYVDLNDIIMPMIGTIGGACLITSKEIEFAIKNVALFKNSENLVPRYLLSILNSTFIQQEFENKSAGATQKFVSLTMIRNLVIPLPSLEVQKKIVEKIEAERELVESAKKLIEIYEQKTKDAVDNLWSE